MFNRKTLLRMAIVVACLAAAFAVYVRWVVPEVEPVTILVKAIDAPSEPEVARGTRLGDCFPPGAWELDERNILIESGNLLLILRSYEAVAGNVLQCGRCTALITPSKKPGPDPGPNAPSAPDIPVQATVTGAVKSPGEVWSTEVSADSGPPIIVSMPSGAKIHLSEPISRESRDVSVVWGELHGPITISWRGKKGDGSDRFTLETSNVIYENGTVRSDNPVEFQFGRHSGRGVGFISRLVTSTPGQGQGLAFDGVGDFELTRLDHIELRLLKSDFAGTSPEHAEWVDRAFQNQDEIPVLLTCAGIVECRTESREVVFHDRVRMECRYAALPPDVLTCDELRVALYDAAPAGTDAEKSLSNLALERVTAVGTPLRFESPSRQFAASGQTFEVSLLDRYVALNHPTQETTLRLDQFEFHCASIEYHFPPPDSGQLGSIQVNGRGWVRYTTEARSVRASWRTELRAYPDVEDEYAILFTGDVTLDSPEFGEIAADQLYVWMKKRPEVPGGPALGTPALGAPDAAQSGASVESLFGAYYPARVDSEGNIRFRLTRENTTVNGTLRHIQVWLEPTAAFPDALLAAQSSGTSQTPAWAQGDASGTEPPRELSFAADYLKAKLLILPTREPTFYASYVELRDGIQVVESVNYQSDDPPMRLTGTRVVVSDVTPQTLNAQIVGEPAVLAARGVEVSGQSISLNNSANRVWMNAGKMTVQLTGMNPPHPVTLTWDGNMQFDGQTLEISGNVRVDHPLHQIRTDRVVMTLVQRLSFQAPPRFERGAQAQNFIAHVMSQGRIRFQNQTVKDGVRTCLLRADVSHLDFEPQSGDFAVRGEGRMSATFVPPESGEFMGLGGAGASGGTEARAGADAARMPDVEFSYDAQGPEPEVPGAGQGKGLYHVSISFLDGVSGNIHDLHLTFSRDVRAAGDSVPDWETVLDPNDEPHDLGRYGVVLSCDEMTVNRVPELTAPTTSRRSENLEFHAQNNVTVEVIHVSAHGDSLTFSSAKSTLALSGKVTPVRIIRQSVSDGSTSRLRVQKAEINLKERVLKCYNLNFPGNR